MTNGLFRVGAAPVPTTSTLDIITLILASVGVALAALSLGWQAATFVLSGSRVRATLRLGALRRELGQVARMTGPLDMTVEAGASMVAQGFTEPVLVAEVRNRGRLTVSVDDVTAMTKDGWGFSRAADPDNPTLPYRLEPGEKQTWHVELRPLQLLVNQDGKSRDARMHVSLGTGKVIRTKSSFRIVPLKTS